MSTILVDMYGRPLAADPIGPSYGPIRFEDQPASVRRRGRKGRALRGSRKATRRSTRSSARSSRRSSSRKSSRRAYRKSDYRPFLSARSGTYGPVAFEAQPAWVRSGGRKSRAWSKKRSSKRGVARLSRRVGRKASRRSTSRRATLTRKAKRALNRQAFRASKSSSRGRRSASKRSSSRRTSRKSSRRAGTSRRGMTRRSRGSRRMTRKASGGASRVLSYNKLMSQLRRKPKLKAWVCVGERRTGCGGGRKGKRGSRQFGVLRP